MPSSRITRRGMEHAAGPVAMTESDMARTLAVLFAALLCSVPAVAQHPPAQTPAVRWSAAACRGRGVYADSRDAEASVVANGRVHVQVKDSAGTLLGERTVDGPHWRTRFTDCEAM